MLLASGLPAAFWPYACKYWCVQSNVWTGAWEKRFKEQFRVKWMGTDENCGIPFGSLVKFIPAATDKEKRIKPEPNAKPGIFLGFRTVPGGKVGSVAMVAKMSEFWLMDLHR